MSTLYRMVATRLAQAVAGWPQSVRCFIIVGCGAVVAGLDYITGTDYVFLPFYLALMAGATWWTKPAPASIANVAVAAEWGISNYILFWNATPISHGALLWSGAMVLGVFAAFGVTMHRTKHWFEEQKASRSLLMESEARLLDAIGSFPGGFSLWNAEDRLVLCNARLKEMWPYIADLMVPGVSLDYVTRVAVQRTLGLEGAVLEARVQEILAGFHDRTLLDYHSGQRWVRLLRNRVAKGGTIALMLDITEQKQHEEDLRQVLKIEAIGQLTGGIAHEFNNLLTVIVGHSDMLLGDTEAGAQSRHSVQMISEAAARASALTQRLLAYARRQNLQATSVDLGDVVSGMEGLLRSTLGETIEVECIVRRPLWKVLADVNQVENALINLAANARDAMPRGGKLIIETSNETPAEAKTALTEGQEPGQGVMLTVSDTGQGMSPQVIDRAFDPFFTTKDIGKGTGLGLSMVHGFVTQSGGHIDIQSQEGVGTSVRMFLPRLRESDSDEAARSHEPDEPPALGRETVLIVEDNELVLASVKQQMEALGYRILSSRNSAEALSILNRGDPVDLLFTDIVMPGRFDGRQLAQEARRTHPDLRVLLTSGSIDRANLEDIAHRSDVELLMKPYHTADLAKKIRSVLNGRQ